jgi:hypothetical protein
MNLTQEKFYNLNIALNVSKMRHLAFVFSSAIMRALPCTDRQTPGK